MSGPPKIPSAARKIGLAVFACSAALIAYIFLPASCPEPAKRTAAVFILAACFWASEVIPLFATSLVVILLLVFSLARPGGALGMDQNGYQIFLLPFSSPVIMLFLGGFVLARVVQKHRLDQLIVGRLLRVFGDKPYPVLLGFILVTGFISLWMSHTAATALMLAMIGPVLSHLDPDDLFKKALVLAIPFAANIGGIGTPVGTPPNAIAIGILADEGIKINFLSWMMMAVPLALALLLITSVILYLMFRPKQKRLRISFEAEGRLGGRAKAVLGIALLTIILWLTSGWHGIPESIVSLLSVGLFAAFGLLNREDINSIHWDILILMWGGLALGKAMEVSGLGEWIVGLPLFAQEGFLLVATFCLLTVFVSIFISNTPTANLIVPLAMSVPGENKVLLAVIVALSCSFDMILPISTPSNALAFSTNVISTKDMLKSGIVVIVIAIAFVLLGYPFFIGPMSDF